MSLELQLLARQSWFRILEYDPCIKPTIEWVLQRIHPDDRAMIRQLIDETSSGEKDFGITHRLLIPDGSVKFVHVLSHAPKEAAGNLGDCRSGDGRDREYASVPRSRRA